MNEDKMELEEAIDILKNKICDDVISDYCEKENHYCKSLCENEECYLIQAIETVLQALENSIPKKKIEDKILELQETVALENASMYECGDEEYI